MTYQDTHDEELPFSADFATRVLAEADAIATQRQRVRFAAAAVSVAALIGAMSFGASQTWLRGTPATQHIPKMVASIDPDAMSLSPRRQTTLMDIMFPHAAAVAEFSDQYADGDSVDTLEDDAVFFPDAEVDAANES